MRYPGHAHRSGTTVSETLHRRIRLDLSEHETSLQDNYGRGMSMPNSDERTWAEQYKIKMVEILRVTTRRNSGIENGV
jgi:hypothetical protein